METVWFWLIALLLTTYVVLDGFDLGAGAIYLFAARTDRERRTVLQSIGPVWDANEVWLLAAGGSLVLAFPRLYASSFSGFYLPLMIVLWLLILRAVAIEFRSHLDSRVWRPFWDTVFWGASLALTIVLGAALGNVVRGVPLDQDGYFFAPLWTSFTTRGDRLGVLDWFTVTVGITSCLALVHHGALWVALKTSGALNERATRVAARVWPALLMAVVLVTVLTFRVQPHVSNRLATAPVGWILPALAVSGLVGALVMRRRGREAAAFLGSCFFLAGMMLSVSYGLYPLVLPATNAEGVSLTVQNAASAPYGLGIALFWWIPGMLLVLGYTTFIYRRMAGKVVLDEEGY
jgi:cytochrome d ubiquinol oxidase subunit II